MLYKRDRFDIVKYKKILVWVKLCVSRRFQELLIDKDLVEGQLTDCDVLQQLMI